ncbi:MAG: rane protein of unknown function [Candidatus Saccharibacteria bacterium]|nr:rane protein of unknown function [Candidatus Saccharibacteria bacterium]
MYDKLLLLFAQYEVKIGPLPHTDADATKIQSILAVVFTVIGAMSVLFIVIGGMRYISSQGDPGEIAKAKNTLIYAIIGLLVSIASVAIVTFVLQRAG